MPRESASARGAAESPTQRASSAESPDAKTTKGVRYGTLVAHGEAPYRHDATQSASYFVTLKDAAGQERTSWGVGLKDALLESKTAPAVNDLVGIRRAGSTPVTVMQRSVDEDGEVIAQAIGAKRHNWEVEKAEYFTQRSGAPPQDHRPTSTVSEKTAVSTTKERPAQELGTQALTREQEAAAAIRSAATTREELQLKYPGAEQSRVSASRLARPVCRGLRQEWSHSRVRSRPGHRTDARSAGEQARARRRHSRAR